MSEADSQNLQQIAKVLKSSGTDGGLLMGFRDIDPEDIDLKEPVFIVFDGLPVPFFIKSLTRKGTNKAIVHLHDILNLDDAEEIVGREVYADESTLPEAEDDDEMDLSVFIGWTVYNDDVEVGEVTDFEDIPGNPCLYIESASGQVMIPLHEDFILSVSPDSGELHLSLPEGLL